MIVEIWQNLALVKERLVRESLLTTLFFYIVLGMVFVAGNAMHNSPFGRRISFFYQTIIPPLTSKIWSISWGEFSLDYINQLIPYTRKSFGCHRWTPSIFFSNLTNSILAKYWLSPCHYKLKYTLSHWSKQSLSLVVAWKKEIGSLGSRLKTQCALCRHIILLFIKVGEVVWSL